MAFCALTFAAWAEPKPAPEAALLEQVEQLRSEEKWAELEPALLELLTAPAANDTVVANKAIAVLSDEHLPQASVERVSLVLTKRFPECGECWNLRALTLLSPADASPERIEDGLAAMRHAVMLSPDDLATRTNLGLAELRAGHEAEGLRMLELVLRDRPPQALMSKIVMAAGRAWARTSPVHFRLSELEPPSMPLALAGRSDRFPVSLRQAVAASKNVHAKASKVAEAWCGAVADAPSNVRLLVSGQCTQWTAYGASLDASIGVDHERLNRYLSQPKHACRERRAAIFGFLVAWPEADEQVGATVRQRFASMPACSTNVSSLETE